MSVVADTLSSSHYTRRQAPYDWMDNEGSTFRRRVARIADAITTGPRTDLRTRGGRADPRRGVVRPTNRCQHVRRHRTTDVLGHRAVSSP